VPARLAEVWPVTCSEQIACTSSGVSAAIWNSRHPAEIWGESVATDVITFTLRPYDCEAWADGKLLPIRRPAPASLQIMPAGVSPRARFSTSMELLHVYYPHARLAELASLRPGAVELRDPTGRVDREIAVTCQQMVREMTDKAPMSQMHFDALTISLGVQLLRRWSNAAASPAPSRGGLAPYQLRRVTDYIGDRLTDELSLQEPSGLVGLSAHHFCRVFKQSTGLPPHRWQIRQRVERAKALMLDTDLSLAEIAVATGFADQSHFTTVFRKTVGDTPNAWRRATRS
jgi:AraC-like DNA-binding protein